MESLANTVETLLFLDDDIMPAGSKSRIRKEMIENTCVIEYAPGGDYQRRLRHLQFLLEGTPREEVKACGNHITKFLRYVVQQAQRDDLEQFPLGTRTAYSGALDVFKRLCQVGVMCKDFAHSVIRIMAILIGRAPTEYTDRLCHSALEAMHDHEQYLEEAGQQLQQMFAALVSRIAHDGTTLEAVLLIMKLMSESQLLWMKSGIGQEFLTGKLLISAVGRCGVLGFQGELPELLTQIIHACVNRYGTEVFYNELWEAMTSCYEIMPWAISTLEFLSNSLFGQLDAAEKENLLVHMISGAAMFMHKGMGDLTSPITTLFAENSDARELFRKLDEEQAIPEAIRAKLPFWFN